MQLYIEIVILGFFTLKTIISYIMIIENNIKKEIDMRKKRSIICFVCIMLLLAGCGSVAKTDMDGNASEEMLQELSESEQNMETEEKDGNKLEKELCYADQHPATILEDATALYFCGKKHILKVDKESKETCYIWENTQQTKQEDAFEYSATRGILVSGKLYFIEERTEDAMWGLSVVCTDGSGYKSIINFENTPYDREARLLLLDGILYYAFHLENKVMEGYPLDANGMLLMDEKIDTKVENIPANYLEEYYFENGSRVLSAIESKKRFGYYLLCDEDYELCIVDLESGIKKEFPTVLMSYNLITLNDEYFLFGSYSEEKMMLMETQTLECRELSGYNSDISVISMDEDYVYTQKVLNGDDFTQYQYLRIALETGICEELFTIDSFVGMEVDSPWFLMDISVLNDYLYYVGVMDYKLYLMRRALDMPAAEETLGEAFYDTGIGEIGTLESYKETIYSTKQPEIITGNLDLEWLVVDSRYPGAGKINDILYGAQLENIEYIHENAQMADNWDDVDSVTLSFNSNVSPIYYMDGRYFSFVQKNYDYSGGVHGMPFWVGYTFDLETGQELMLSDIIAEDDVAIKEIVTKYFTELYNMDPDAYWEDADEIVRESASLMSPFYLSEEGIVFFYGPYELAPYAGGFPEVVVPYSEFNLKI